MYKGPTTHRFVPTPTLFTAPGGRRDRSHAHRIAPPEPQLFRRTHTAADHSQNVEPPRRTSTGRQRHGQARNQPATSPRHRHTTTTPLSRTLASARCSTAAARAGRAGLEVGASRLNKLGRIENLPPCAARQPRCLPGAPTRVAWLGWAPRFTRELRGHLGIQGTWTSRTARR